MCRLPLGRPARGIPVAPDGLGAVWPRLRAPLATIEAPDGWLPEDVYVTLKMGGATLYLIVIDDKEVGFPLWAQRVWAAPPGREMLG